MPNFMLLSYLYNIFDRNVNGYTCVTIHFFCFYNALFKSCSCHTFTLFKGYTQQILMKILNVSLVWARNLVYDFHKY